LQPVSSHHDDGATVALVEAPSRGSELIFGRPLLERMLRVCERAGVSRFFVKCPAPERPRFADALGRFSEDSRVCWVDSFDQVRDIADEVCGISRCVVLSGNIVFSLSQLRDLLERHAANGHQSLRLASRDPAASVAVGNLADFLGGDGRPPVTSVLSQIAGLPYALDGHPSDRNAAERVIAATLRHDTARTDGIMARIFDRKLSWRLSYLLAHTAVTPNQVTLANTAIGMLIAWMFAQPGYWMRLAGALLFVVSITIDGVDGELARLKMAESAAGARLDALTDNLVHIAIFFGISIGCYRTAHSTTYLYVLGALLVGFGMCAIAVHRAMSVSVAGAQDFIRRVDRLTGRDFAYLVLLLAVVDRLNYFIIGAAAGTYLFAAVLWWLTTKWTRPGAAHQPGGDRLAEGI